MVGGKWRARGRSLMVVALGMTVASAASACGILDPGEDIRREPRDGETTVLFIGSSYLAFNDVPKRFQEISRKAGRQVFVKAHAVLGRSLATHASSAGAIHVIRERDWDFVVLQGGAQGVAYPRGYEEPVLPALRELYRIATEDSPSTRVVWMMPWAYEDGMLWREGRTEDYHQMQLDIREKTLEWSQDVGLAVAPVGMAFFEVLTEWDPGPHFLHDTDWNHASKAGSFLAAATFFSTIFLENSVDVSYRWTLERDLAADLRQVASSVVLGQPEVWNISWAGGG